VKHQPIRITRDSRTGQFKPEEWGNKHPRISEHEIVYKPSPKKG
jgi:hypothetical protein